MKKIASTIALYIFIAVSSAYGAWQGPDIVLEGGWGSTTGQFGIRSGDAADEFPSMLAISPSGKVLVGDGFNIRIQIFNTDGSFNNSITPKGFPTSYRTATYWPLSLFICGDQNIYAERNEYIQIYDMSGSLTRNLTNLDGGIVFVDQQCNFYTYNPSSNRYFLYSPTGQLIKTSTTRPAELGVVKSARENPDGSGRTVIEFNDNTFNIQSPRLLEFFKRDSRGGLYGAIITGAPGKQYYRVYKYDRCGKVVGSVDLPTNNITIEQTMPRQPTPIVTVVEEYGQPVIAPSGDVYTWKRTPTTYSILKWTWVDDPNTPSGPDAPSGLKVDASTNGLYLTWTASPQDPGCVTGYEISRATGAGGSGTTVGTITPGKLTFNDSTAASGTTYYYKVRAVSGSEYSPFTSEVSGRRP